MKKCIALILVSVFMLCLPACVTEGNNSKVFETLNSYVQAGTKNYTIQLTVTAPDGSTVNETYTVTTADDVRSVAYEIERRNAFTIENGVITAPEDAVTVTSGIYDAAESAKSDYDLPAFCFSDESLRNFQNREGLPPFSFSADVISTEKLMGKLISGSDIKIEGTYTIGKLEAITLSYKTLSGNTVAVTYTYG